MELQRFRVDGDFSFTISVNNFIEDTDIFIIFRRGINGTSLSAETTQKLFKCLPKINKLQKKIMFEGTLMYFLSPEEAGAVTNLILTRKYDRRRGCFKRGWYLETRKYGAVYRPPIILPISEDVLIK